MGYDANGNWTQEDDSVTNRVTGLLAQNSPLMQQAKTRAKQSANRRGLLNSSMAVGAGQQATLNAALPIASQEANQAHAKNLAAQGHAQTKEIQSADISSKEKIADMNVGAHDRQYASGFVAEVEKKYGAMFNEVLKNNNLSSAQRDKYYGHLATLRDSDMQLVEQLYGIDLDWATAGAEDGTTASATHG